MTRIGKPRRANESTMASVSSDEPESTTTISANPARLSRHLPIQAASLRQITAALRPSAPPEGGSECSGGDKVAGSVNAIEPSVSPRRGVHLPSEGSLRIGRYLGHLLKAGKFREP